MLVRAARRASRCALLLAGVAALAACSFGVLGPRRVEPVEKMPRVSAAAPAPVFVNPAPSEPLPVAPEPILAPASPLTRVLAYGERVRSMPPAELHQEAARLGAPSESAQPASQMQLALVLGQMRQLPELIRAHELLSRVLGNGSADAQPLHALARLMAFRFGEQRRVEDQLDKERQQSRELQKRLDQTSERLEALKAIERSLTSRPPPAPPAAAAPAPAARASVPARPRSSAP
jgi:hypothetical protein